MLLHENWPGSNTTEHARWKACTSCSGWRGIFYPAQNALKVEEGMSKLDPALDPKAHLSPRAAGDRQTHGTNATRAAGGESSLEAELAHASTAERQSFNTYYSQRAWLIMQMCPAARVGRQSGLPAPLPGFRLESQSRIRSTSPDAATTCGKTSLLCEDAAFSQTLVCALTYNQWSVWYGNVRWENEMCNGFVFLYQNARQYVRCYIWETRLPC